MLSRVSSATFRAGMTRMARPRSAPAFSTMLARTVPRAMSGPMQAAVRCFSDDVPAEEEGPKMTLEEVLEVELQDTVEHIQEIEENMTEAPNGFDVSDDGKAEVVLTKVAAGEKITVKCDAANLENNAEDDEDEEDYEGPQDQAEQDHDEEAENDEETTSDALGVNCDVTFEKSSTSISMNITAWSDGAWTINTISQSEDHHYNGPKMADLDDNLVQSLYDHIEDRGFDEHLAMYVTGLCYKKEVHMYQDWLNHMETYAKA